MPIYANTKQLKRHLIAIAMLLWLSLLLSSSVAFAADSSANLLAPQATITITDAPKDKQLIPRNLATNSGTVTIAGTISGSGVSQMRLDITRNNSAYSSVTQAVNYSGSTATFSFNSVISAELASYDFTLRSSNGSSFTFVADYEDIVAGDAYIIQGQSNAVAKQFNGNANGNQSDFIRSFSISGNSGGVSNDSWHYAEGNNQYASGAVGQWGLRLGRLIVDNQNIPVAIINGAQGGEDIAHFQRNDGNHDDLSTNYGRLLNRLDRAGLTGAVRGVYWYQGENDFSDASGHQSGWISLYNDWLNNYPTIEKIYIMQIRNGNCGGDLGLREVQRQLQDMFAKVQTMSTTALNGHDGCHFAYTNGYEALADRLYGVTARDFYGSTATQNIDAPNILRAWFTNTSYNTIVMELRDTDDTVTWDSGAQNDFDLEGSGIAISGGSVSGNLVTLTLSGNGSSATGLSYKGRPGVGPWVKNSNGVGLLTFQNVPISLTPLSPTSVTVSAINADSASGHALLTTVPFVLLLFVTMTVVTRVTILPKRVQPIR